MICAVEMLKMAITKRRYKERKKMCGFTGFWDLKATTRKSDLNAWIENMADKIRDRGPDSSGIFTDEKKGIAFAFRRLAILDLSPLGEQPMRSPDGRFTIIFNGEVYNFLDLKEELIKRGYHFKSHSDTEVMLASFNEWGVEGACKKFIGMFAFALWDNQENKLFLARDRMGIKPLYFGFQQGILFFGSQPKSFLPHPKFKPEIEQQALSAYFRFNYVPAPLSIFNHIQKLKPGTLRVFNAQGLNEEICFWGLEEIVKQNKGLMTTNRLSTSEYIEQLDHLLHDAIRLRMIADVPLGAFLSGGVDSSTVVAIMQAQSLSKVKTFTIGFHEQGYDEAKHAMRVAKHLGTEHYELYLSTEETQKIIPEIPNWCDEPFADVSQIPTFLVSRLARNHVTVSLSGDGGDELFAGYNRYFLGNRLHRLLYFIPMWLRYASSNRLRSVRPNSWEKLSNVLPMKLKPRLLADKMMKLADILACNSNDSFYQSLVSHWDNPRELLPAVDEPTLYPWNSQDVPHELNFIEKMQFMDMLTYLPDDILTKVDRASMAIGLEARVPLLDHRVVEFSWRLPLDLKIREGKGKWLLRQVLHRYVPKALIDRPKMGFGVPIDRWVRGPLRAWAEHYLSEDQLESSGLRPDLIRHRWQAHLEGRQNWQYALWSVLMYQAWREYYKF